MLFSRKDDLELLNWGYKRSREHARRMPSYRGEFVPNHPQFAETSVAACKGEIQPVPIDAPDIAYTEEDEKAIELFTRKNGTSTLNFAAAHSKTNTDIRRIRSVATAWHSVSDDIIIKSMHHLTMIHFSLAPAL